MTLRVLIAVTHLLGAGHLTRAAALARSFAARGHAVTLVSGGMPASLIRLDAVELVQLPPVRSAGTDFRTLLDPSGNPADQAYLAARRDRLVSTFAAARPDVLITELFPFGRRSLAAEFLDLLEAAHARPRRPLVACSVRDILAAPSKPERVAETHARLARFYDLVLVHGDPDLVPLAVSWPLDESLGGLVRYTGYVDEGESIAPAAERGGILVSGGSSAASLPLYRAALEAADRLADRPWRLLLGNGIDEPDFRRIQAAAPAHVVVERARRDFRALLSRAAVSVSQAGYNTVVDLLRTGTAAVLVPFEAGQETEQRLRAERLHERGLAVVVPEAALSGRRLAKAIRVATDRRPGRHSVALNGSARTVEIVEAAVGGVPAVQARWDWTPLQTALARARDAGYAPRFWWRDDDAVADTPPLGRLLALAERHRAPVALAVIPRLADPSLGRALESSPWACALVHGLSHRNHAATGAKKAEFGRERPVAVQAEELREALLRSREIAGSKLLAVFVPPWNRLAAGLVPLLPDLGYAGLSAFADRDRREPARGLIEVNTHVDPIDWHGSRSLVPPEVAIAAAAGAVERRVAGRADRDEPIGLLTHHLVHDEAVWRFCEALLEVLARQGVGFATARCLFW
ncbi:MAG TPA: glycosyltransferase [Microvirga sp.]|nr:glycosyltransferase [Microvirga sp.]